MADGGRAGEPITRVEIAARMLAAASSPGSFMRCHVATIGDVPAESRGEVVGIAWRGGREESAARSIGGGTRAAALHGWSRAGGKAALPSFRHDMDAVAGMGRVERVPAALLSVYALQAWHEWPLVEKAALVCITGRGSREAVCDAMGRILWRVAAVSQDRRASMLGMRAASYRTLTGDAEALLKRWLHRGACQYLDGVQALKETRKAVGWNVRPFGSSEPCALRSETWWHPKRKRTD